MSKKKRTRQQKEKARQRRMRELQYIQSDNRKEEPAEIDDKKIVSLSPTPVNKQSSDQAVVTDSVINMDLRKVVILIILFFLILSVLVITENQHQYLTPLANRIIDFLLSI